MAIGSIFELFFDHKLNAAELFQYLFEKLLYFDVFTAAAAHYATCGGIDKPQKASSFLIVLELLQVDLLWYEARSIFA
jgi:hypothetical protein